MAIITRLQALLLRLGLSHLTGQAVFIAALLGLLFVWAFRLDGLDVSAKSTQFPARFGTESQGVQWKTVYEFEPEDLNPAKKSFAEDGTPISSKTFKASMSQVSGESLFLQSYHLQQQGDFVQALKLAEDLVHRFPNFQLGNLLLADLAAALAATPSAMDAAWQKPEAQRRLRELKIEAEQRTRYSGQDSYIGKQPEMVRYVSPAISHVVVVEAQKSRLYVLARKANANWPAPLQVIFDAYVSVGNNGLGKWREGDSKTPVGVYFVQKQLTDPMLPDLYGSGALTLDYPSPIDRWQKRTGSGIWLHGSPSSQYARAPTATDGCVVLANDDMLRLIQLGIQPGTPVVIAENLNWQPVTTSPTGATAMASSTPFAPGIPATWPESSGSTDESNLWRMVSAFQWKDAQQTVAVVSYDPPAFSGLKQRRHTYWTLQGDHWQELSKSEK